MADKEPVLARPIQADTQRKRNGAIAVQFQAFFRIDISEVAAVAITRVHRQGSVTIMTVATIVLASIAISSVMVRL